MEKADAAGDDRADLLAQLQEIDDASSKIFVPRSKLAEYIDFRQFLHDMRDRIASGDERKLEAEVLATVLRSLILSSQFLILNFEFHPPSRSARAR